MTAENSKTTLLLVIVALLFFIFSTGRATPSILPPQTIVALP